MNDKKDIVQSEAIFGQNKLGTDSLQIFPPMLERNPVKTNKISNELFDSLIGITGAGNSINIIKSSGDQNESGKVEISGLNNLKLMESDQEGEDFNFKTGTD